MKEQNTKSNITNFVPKRTLFNKVGGLKKNKKKRTNTHEEEQVWKPRQGVKLG